MKRQIPFLLTFLFIHYLNPNFAAMPATIHSTNDFNNKVVKLNSITEF